MTNSVIAPLVLDGWFLLHQFFRAELPPSTDEGSERPAFDQDAAESLQRLLTEWEDLGDGGWSGLYRVIGGEVDYMLMHMRPSLDGLGEAERALRADPSAGDLFLVEDYLSVVELGMYGATADLVKEAGADGIEIGSPEWEERGAALLEREREKRYVRERLFPRQPEEMPYACFYPMDKRRAVEQNWYSLPVGTRAKLMHDHGSTGRRYAGRISQIISGSVGFDDWEWAVTLFAADPLDFKAIVTEMRYDEVSAVYAEFGNFRVGRRIPASEVAEELSG